MSTSQVLFQPIQLQLVHLFFWCQMSLFPKVAPKMTKVSFTANFRFEADFLVYTFKLFPDPFSLTVSPFDIVLDLNRQKNGPLLYRHYKNPKWAASFKFLSQKLATWHLFRSRLFQNNSQTMFTGVLRRSRYLKSWN